MRRRKSWIAAALLSGAVTLAPTAGVGAAEFFEGLWAKTRAECLDDEGPNSRTYIDLSNKEKGKIAPIYDQYENHCRIQKTTMSRDRVALSLTCFEFWENYEKGKEPSKTIVKIDKQNDRLLINGVAYIRCRKR